MEGSKTARVEKVFELHPRRFAVCHPATVKFGNFTLDDLTKTIEKNLSG